ncbi:MAG: FAD:protein FMN transferase [Luteolibacter sp.]|nr:FAD:protein FMN transferase [Luteolibacter sp.]
MTSTVTRPSVIPPDAHGVRRVEFKALGTNCLIKFRLGDEHKALSFAADALAWLDRFEAKFSRFRPSSLVSRVNAAAGGDWIPVDDEMEHMLNLADDLHQRTDGILDPTILPLLRVWDWKKVHQKLPEAAEVKTALALTGWKKVRRRPGAVRLPEIGMGLDFGGFGKEYAVDFLARIARQYGITDALVDLGRDIFALGGNGAHPFWHIGIEDGNRPGNCWGGLAVTDHAVSASGDYARNFSHQGVRYGHILDPRTGWPVANGMRAVTVIARSCLEAGVYSTAVFVLGPRAGLHLASLARGVEVCAQSESGIEGSRGFSRYLVQAA